MGKRSSGKAKIANGSVKPSKPLSFQKRNEINDAVKNLLKIASEPSSNAKADWENHLEIVKVLDGISKTEQVFTPSKREEHFPKLMEWIKSHGGLTENVKITNFGTMEYGLQAVKTLNQGDVVCTVPQSVMMTLENVHNSSLKHLYSKDPILKNMGNIALSLFLLLEYLKGTNSFWYPYISSLPAKYNTVLYFTVDELKELKCSPTFEPALKHCKNIARQYAYFYQVFQKSDDEASRLLRNNFTYQLYRWAVSTVMTRQNYIPARDGTSSLSALIPLWDMCNHANGHLTTQFNSDEKRSECLAFKTFQEGEQVLIFYGKRSNSDFLLHNGFVHPENEHDTYRLRLGISKSDPLYDGRVKLLTRIGIPASGDFYLYCGTEPLDSTLLAFLRIFNMDEANLKHWSESNRAENLGCIDCSLDTAIECKVWNFLFNRTKLLLSGYPQTPEIDAGDVTSPRQLVRLLIKLEMDLLRSVLEYVQQRLKV